MKKNDSGISNLIKKEKIIEHHLKCLDDLKKWAASENLDIDLNLLALVQTLKILLNINSDKIRSKGKQLEQQHTESKPIKQKNKTGSIKKEKAKKAHLIGRAKKIYGRQACQKCLKYHEEFWLCQLSNNTKTCICRFCYADLREQSKQGKINDKYNDFIKPWQEVSGGGVNPK